MKNIRDIRAEIAKREEEIAQLLPRRKEEIFNVLKASGGLSLDNRMLAGLAVYAVSEEGKKSEFLQELAKVGSKYLPRPGKGKVRVADEAKRAASSPTEISIKAEKIDG